MVEEFKRFGLPNRRVLTGFLQISGAIGLLLGLLFPLIGCLASGGLTLLMLMGFAVRVKIGDDTRQSLSSFTFLLINSYLFYAFLELLEH